MLLSVAVWSLNAACVLPRDRLAPSEGRRRAWSQLLIKAPGKVAHGFVAKLQHLMAALRLFLLPLHGQVLLVHLIWQGSGVLGTRPEVGVFFLLVDARQRRVGGMQCLCVFLVIQLCRILTRDIDDPWFVVFELLVHVLWITLLESRWLEVQIQLLWWSVVKGILVLSLRTWEPVVLLSRLLQEVLASQACKALLLLGKGMTELARAAVSHGGFLAARGELLLLLLFLFSPLQELWCLGARGPACPEVA